MQRALVQIPFSPHKESKQPLQRKPSLGHQGGHRGGLGGVCHLPCEAQPQLVPLSCSCATQFVGSGLWVVPKTGDVQVWPCWPCWPGHRHHQEWALWGCHCLCRAVGEPSTAPCSSCRGFVRAEPLQRDLPVPGTLQPSASWHRNHLMGVAGLLLAE